jgi:ATP-dependent DNA ligase
VLAVERVFSQGVEKDCKKSSRQQLNSTRWRTPEAFDDGEALWQAVCEHELEGIVAKRRSGRSLAGRRDVQTWARSRSRSRR